MIYFDLHCKVTEDWTKLDEESIRFLRETLGQFVEKAVDKYVKGYREHGREVIYERPMLCELENEHIDSIFYLAGLKIRIEEKELEP
jgi:hypothetical protein